MTMLEYIGMYGLHCQMFKLSYSLSIIFKEHIEAHTGVVSWIKPSLKTLTGHEERVDGQNAHLYA